MSVQWLPSSCSAVLVIPSCPARVSPTVVLTQWLSPSLRVSPLLVAGGIDPAFRCLVTVVFLMACYQSPLYVVLP
jgi:hypothetical protein